MSRLRLLFLVHQFGNQTGVELHTQTLAEGLSDRYEVSIAWPSAEGVHLLRVPSQNATTFPAEPPVWPQSPYQAERTKRSLDEIFRLVQPDLIHIQHFLNWPLGVIDQAANFGAKVVVSFHDHFAISPLPVFQLGDSVAETLTPAYSMKTFGRDLSQWLRERRGVLRRSLERADALVTVSPYIERQLTTVFPVTFRLIEYGIVGFEPLPKRPATAGLRFGFLGQLVPIKGWESLVSGFAEVRRRHPTCELHLFGGEQPDAPPGVTYHGPYESADLADICSRLDVGVVPSIVAETYCMVVSELWRGGLPVAAADLGALSDRVIEHVNGIKFRPGDPASIAQALCWFAEHDEWRQWSLPQPKLVPEMVADYDRLYCELRDSHSTPLGLPQGLGGFCASPNVDATSSSAKAVEPLGQAQGRTNVGHPNDLLIVQSCGFIDEGDGVYRLHSPSRALSRLEGVSVIDCHPFHRELPGLAETADVLILSSFDEDVFPLLERRRAAGRVTVLEANDFYFDPQPWNTGATAWLNRSLEDWFCHLLRLSDGVQASTPELARRWRERTARPVAVFANQLADLPPLKPARSGPLTIGWGGSLGHLADWYQLAPGLQKWLDANPDVHLAVMTNDDARPFFRLAPERYHFQTFGTLAEFLEFLDRLDIGLAPLLPTDFNRCRSDVKFLEYASRGVVGVYADLEPYHDSIEHGRTGFLYRTEAELFACLDALVADARLRERVRQDAYAQVAQDRRLEDHIDERLTFYRELLGTVRVAEQATSASSPLNRPWARPRGSTASALLEAIANIGIAQKPPSPRGKPGGVVLVTSLLARIASLAEADGRYFQLRPQEPEQILVAAIEGPSTRESAAALARLVERYPDYFAAIQRLGATLNDLHDSRAALPYLERARQLNPQAAEPLCQLARLSHKQGQLDQARRQLEAAIEINPYSPRAWRYLLRLLPILAANVSRGATHLRSSVAPRPSSDEELDLRGTSLDDRDWAERARKLHPANYSLALMGVPLYPREEAIALLEQLLNTYAPQLRADDIAAVAHFSVTIAAVAGPCLDRPEAVQLVRHAGFVFPQSVRLSDMLARALTQAGTLAAAHAEYVRGQQLRRAALCYRTEFPKDDETVPLRLLAEHLSGMRTMD